MAAAFLAGCNGEMKTEDVRAEREKLMELKKDNGFPLKLKETGDGTLDAGLGLIIEMANRKMEECEKVVAVGANPQFQMVDDRMEQRFKELGIKDPTLEERQKVRGEVSAGLTPEERKDLANASRVYEQTAAAYRKDQDANNKKFLGLVKDLGVKIAAVAQGGGAGAALVALASAGPAAKAQDQLDVATDAWGICDRIIAAYEARAVDAMAMSNLSSGK